MFEKNQNIQDSLDQTLKQVENNPSLPVELSEAELVAIVGGAYIKTVNTTLTKKILTLTAECTTGDDGGDDGGDTGGECGGDCHICTP